MTESHLHVGLALPTYGAFADPELLLDISLEGEELGYDGAWMPDHIVVPQDLPPHLVDTWTEPFVLAAYLAGRVKRIEIGLDVTVVPYRSPFVLAKMAMDLARLSHDRFVLGVGVGYLAGEFDILGVPYGERGSRTDETLEVMRHLWTGKPVAFAGEHWRFQDAVLRPIGRPPLLLVGGNGRRAVRRVGHFGDGWHPIAITPDQYARGLKELRAFWTPKPAAAEPVLSYRSGFLSFAEIDEPTAGRTMHSAKSLAEELSQFVHLGVRRYVLAFCPATKEADEGLAAMRQRLRYFSHEVKPLLEGVD